MARQPVDKDVDEQVAALIAVGLAGIGVLGLLERRRSGVSEEALTES
jgi:hypothetical protein